MADRREHPIVEGLTALVAVSLGLAIVLSLGILVVARATGVGDEPTTRSTSSDGRSMYLPKPTLGKQSTGPLVSAGPEKQQPGGPSSSAAAVTAITLQAGETAVAPMQQIDLTGTYPGGEGAVLQVQRFTGGGWQDFPVTMTVSAGRFSTYIQTSQTGPTRLRVADSDTGATSNEVTVTIG
jgi:hypothetical protein